MTQISFFRYKAKTAAYQYISVFEVVSPVGPNLSLSTNVPDVKLESLRLDRLNVESLSRSDVGRILGGQRLQNCCFSGIVLKTDCHRNQLRFYYNYMQGIRDVFHVFNNMIKLYIFCRQADCNPYYSVVLFYCCCCYRNKT